MRSSKSRAKRRGTVELEALPPNAKLPEESPHRSQNRIKSNLLSPPPPPRRRFPPLHYLASLKTTVQVKTNSGPIHGQIVGPRRPVWVFLGALGLVFLIFSALGTGLKIECFSRTPWGSWMAPENKRTGGSAGKNGGLDPV